MLLCAAIFGEEPASNTFPQGYPETEAFVGFGCGVLEALSKAPFEPLDKVSLIFLTIKPSPLRELVTLRSFFSGPIMY